MCLVSCWAKMLGQVDTFILDFEKVFDTPSHIWTGRAEIFFLSQDNCILGMDLWNGVGGWLRLLPVALPGLF